MGKRRHNIDVNNISDLRRHALNTLNMLCDGDIEVEDANAASNIYKDVLGTLKAEIDYNKVIGKTKEIKFFQGEETPIREVDAKQVKQLENKWRGE